MVPALLKVLQTSRQPLLRAAVAAAFRHLARDGTMRSQLAEAGAPEAGGWRRGRGSAGGRRLGCSVWAHAPAG